MLRSSLTTINATSSSHFANVKTASANSNASAAPQATEPQDSFESMWEPQTTISFGGGGISMADLAKAIKKNADGSVTFNFTGVPGVQVEQHEKPSK